MKTPEKQLARIVSESTSSGAGEVLNISAELTELQTFRPLITGALNALSANEQAAWEVEQVATADQIWIHVRNSETASIRPEQGWKLHVSATVVSARSILRKALPVLLRENPTFKIASSDDNVLFLNQGRGGLSQVGKIITVYPNSDEQAVRLATALDEATRGLGGPVIPSDRPLSQGSLVYYRYGGFTGHHVHTKTGKVIAVVKSPTGETSVDYRTSLYTPPDWAVDPFVAAKVAAPLAEPRRLVGGRFMIIAPIYESAASTLFLAVDTEHPRKCVLKRARKHAATDRTGRDAVDRLRNEAEVLSCLTPDPHFPDFYALIEDGDDLYLALEYIEGGILATNVEGLAAKHGMLPGEQMLKWAREIAAALKKMHEHNFVYRDLKSNNIMLTPEGRLVLIDFGLAHKLGGEIEQFNMGTRGYMSPRHKEWEQATLADDIYSFGAMLYFLATRAEPAMAPDESNLLSRPVELLNPAIAPAFQDLIARCLHPDPDERYQSMSEVEAVLLSIDTPMTTPSAWGEEIVPDARSEHEIKTQYRVWARALGDTLCNKAAPARNGQGVVWKSNVLQSGALESRYVNIGSSGQVLALAELVREFDDPSHKSTLQEGVHWLLSESRPDGEIGAGLYVGEAGVACALLRAGQVLHDPTLIAAASSLGKWIATTLPHESPDIFNGSAGRLRQHLLLWDETQDPEHLAFAIEAGEKLLAMAEPTDDGLRWPTPEGYGGNVFLGYAHGAAGIGDALLDLYESTQTERFLDAAVSVGRWLANQAVPLQSPYMEGVQWLRHEGGTLNESFWCHGATGIGAFFLHLASLHVLDGALELAAKAAVTAARATRWAVPVQCHGLAGNIEFLLDMYQATQQPEYLAEAKSLARILETFKGEKDGNLVWSADQPSNYSPDYTIGYAGIAMALLRLASPEQLPRQLTRAGFKAQKISITEPEKELISYQGAHYE